MNSDPDRENYLARRREDILKEISVDLFIREAASSSPVPNGNSIAALAGAQAAALLSMLLTVNRQGLVNEKHEIR